LAATRIVRRIAPTTPIQDVLSESGSSVARR
jgi:hypothetical protein